MGTNLHEFLVDEVGVDMKVAEVNERNSTWHVGTHGSCVLDIYEVASGCLRKISIEEDARTVRPYLASGISLVYLGNLLVYSYLVN